MSASSLFPELPASPGGESAASSLGSTQSLYRKHRPQTFDAAELVGQDAVVRTLKNAIRLDRVAHAYLFTGPRGTGKTTTARLLAKAVNCLDPDPDARPCNVCAACVAINNGSTTDVIEIDAASNRGIDDIRELRERVKFAPTFLKTKFYIVDEAHQITGAAANAFLKTLEEPPPHTKFILATTDPEQLLPTIVSRCQRFDFKRFTRETIVAHLANVADREGVPIGQDALAVIAEHAGGSMRDALGLLDQLASYRSHDGDDAQPISPEDVRSLLGIARSERVLEIAGALADRDAGRGLALINSAFEAGEDPRQLNRQLVALLRAIMFRAAGGGDETDAGVNELAQRFSLADIARHSARFSEIDYRIRHASLPQLPLEIAFVQATLDGSAAQASIPTPVREPERQPASAPSRVQAPEPTRTEPASRSETAERPARPSGQTPIQDPPRTVNEQAEPGSAVNTPIRSVSPGSPITVELLHDLWPKIRLDIKARDRRIEALLSSCDPASVNGAAITLVTNYKFHWEKMNEDASRELVESVIGRLVNQQVSVSTEMRGANGAASQPAPASTRASTLAADHPPATVEAPAPPVAVRSEDEQTVIDAAKHLFDAEEITPPR
ncbi:MAG: DNA polymerase III subunit gamma/tau [Thermomicrobiales bacterium]